MSNLDPALDGTHLQRGEPLHGHHQSFDRNNTAPGTHQYRADIVNGGQTYSSATQQTPYYQYNSGPISQSNAAILEDVSTGSTQPTPDVNSFVTPADQQNFGPGNDEQAAQDDAKRQRACEACRGLKVRCDQDPSQPDVPCKRCAKAGRPCVITQPSRKRQKKADSRVAELEKKLDALTAVLNNQRGVPLDTTLNAAPAQLDTNPAHALTAWQAEAANAQQSPAEPPSKKRRTEEASAEWDSRFAQLQLVGSSTHAKDYLHPDNFASRIASLITPAQGAELFQRYVNEMTAELPLVVFPEGTTANQIFAEKPILYLSIMAAGSFGVTPMHVTIQLQDEAMSAIAELCVRRGVKSMELVQTLQVLSLFYKPPNKAEQTNFYQLIHVAAVMALDIGLGRQYRKQPNAIGRQEVVFSARALTGQNSDLIEARRAWLGCYYLAATASMVLRRPNLVRWTAYMKECIDVLEQSPEAAPTDRLLCEHVKIQHICEDIGQQFLMDDSTAQVNINDPKVTYALNVLENQLSAWKTQVPSGLRSKGLTFFEHVTSLYLHEIALHMNHNIEDFRLPFTEESLRNVDSTPEALSPNKIAAIDACLKAAHGILRTTLQFSVAELLALPMLVFFVRCIYALVILIKMHVAITMPNSELGKIIKPEELKIEEYVQGMLKMFQQMGEGRMAQPEKIMKIMSVLSEWFVNHKENVAKQRTKSASSNQHHMSVSQSDRHGQTPLQMLSQVATGQQQRTQPPEWNVDANNNGAYRQKSMQSQSDPPTYQAATTADPTGAFDPNILSMLDMLGGQDYGWGAGFEQAMDMTLAGMGDLPGYGLGNWSMGTDNNTATYNGNPGTHVGAQNPWEGV